MGNYLTGATLFSVELDVEQYTIIMSNYRYIQPAEKQLLININRQVARLLGYIG